MRRLITGCAIVFISSVGLSGCISTPKPQDHAEAGKGPHEKNEPLRGPWRVTKSLEGKSKTHDENGDTYACVDKACKVSRKVDEKKD